MDSKETKGNSQIRVLEPISFPRLVPINEFRDWRNEYEPWVDYGAYDRWLREQTGKPEAEQMWLREAA